MRTSYRVVMYIIILRDNIMMIYAFNGEQLPFFQTTSPFFDLLAFRRKFQLILTNGPSVCNG
ncbi:MAG: hypothetical protein ACTS6G_05860 [Candidatus Hodgkinia cicadicola]